MARAIMGGDFRAIKKAPAAVEPIDPRLALVDLFAAGQQSSQDFIDLSTPLDAQEPAEEPVADETENLAVEAPEAADEALVQPEPDEEPVA